MNDADVEMHVRAVAEEGYTIVEDAIEPELIDTLRRDLVQLEKYFEVAPAGNSFEGFHTLRLYNLLAFGRRFELIPVHRHVLRLSTAFFDRTPIGQLMTRMTNDIESLSELFASGIISLLGDVVRLGLIIFVMFRTDAALASFSMAAVPSRFGPSKKETKPRIVGPGEARRACSVTASPRAPGASSEASVAVDEAGAEALELFAAAQKAGVPAVTIGPMTKTGRDAQGQPVQTDPVTGAFAPPQAPVISPGTDAFGNPQPPAPSAPPPGSP